MSIGVVFVALPFHPCLHSPHFIFAPSPPTSYVTDDIKTFTPVVAVWPWCDTLKFAQNENWNCVQENTVFELEKGPSLHFPNNRTTHKISSFSFSTLSSVFSDGPNLGGGALECAWNQLIISTISAEERRAPTALNHPELNFLFQADVGGCCGVLWSGESDIDVAEPSRTTGAFKERGWMEYKINKKLCFRLDELCPSKDFQNSAFLLLPQSTTTRPSTAAPSIWLHSNLLTSFNLLQKFTF